MPSCFVFYNAAADSWSQPMQMNLGVPTPRAAHGMSGVEQNLIIFGGKDAEARQNDLHIFNTSKHCSYPVDVARVKIGHVLIRQASG